jgi:hypothetical protein
MVKLIPLNRKIVENHSDGGVHGWKDGSRHPASVVSFLARMISLEEITACAVLSLPYRVPTILLYQKNHHLS